jgi:hypothetical protein
MLLALFLIGLLCLLVAAPVWFFVGALQASWAALAVLLLSVMVALWKTYRLE